jgi:hypothetical protein
MGAALLRFNFIHGDLVRWLGGEYTNAFCDWEEAFEVVDSVRHHPVPPGYPPLDFDRAYRACNEGIPLAGIFECSMSSTWNCERYDNHSTLAPEYDAVREKLLHPSTLLPLLFPFWPPPLPAFVQLEKRERQSVRGQQFLDRKKG